MTNDLRKSIYSDIGTINVALSENANKSTYERLHSKYKLLDDSIDRAITQYAHIVGDANYSHELESLKSILETYLLCDSIPVDTNKTNNATGPSRPNKNDWLIFLSHKSDDKKYGDALRNFIIGLGVKDKELIYTSHPLNKIPLDANIYEYLRQNINAKIFMIILWSDKYLESPACLNEMGAAWVTQADYTNIYVPSFSFGNPKYHECAVDTRKMGAVLNGDAHCKASMIELKKKIQALFKLENDDQKSSFLLDEFINAISEDTDNG